MHGLQVWFYFGPASQTILNIKQTLGFVYRVNPLTAGAAYIRVLIFY